MKSQLENLLDIVGRKGFSYLPVEFNLCPYLEKLYREKTGSDLPYQDYFQMPWRNLSALREDSPDHHRFDRYYPVIDNKTTIDWLGVGHRSSPASMHMTQMLHPLEHAGSVEEIDAYPLPLFSERGNINTVKSEVEALHERGLAAMGNLQMTIWENSWYIRGMENMMMDMMSDDEMAVRLLDRVTDMSLTMAKIYAAAGADIIFLGDDIGMQQTTLMSETLYCEWLQPRLKRIISEIKRISPKIVVFYHSCGFVTPVIPHLIDAGIDVLNPVQPECMDFEDIYERFGGRISFHGTIGTQRTMPFGTPADVRKTVERNMKIAGDKGGLFPAPTHLLEPEVPWENILAYVDVCRNFSH